MCKFIFWYFARRATLVQSILCPSLSPLKFFLPKQSHANVHQFSSRSSVHVSLGSAHVRTLVGPIKLEEKKIFAPFWFPRIVPLSYFPKYRCDSFTRSFAWYSNTLFTLSSGQKHNSRAKSCSLEYVFVFPRTVTPSSSPSNFVTFDPLDWISVTSGS